MMRTVLLGHSAAFCAKALAVASRAKPASTAERRRMVMELSPVDEMLLVIVQHEKRRHKGIFLGEITMRCPWLHVRN